MRALSITSKLHLAAGWGQAGTAGSLLQRLGADAAAAAELATAALGGGQPASGHSSLPQRPEQDPGHGNWQHEARRRSHSAASFSGAARAAGGFVRLSPEPPAAAAAGAGAAGAAGPAPGPAAAETAPVSSEAKEDAILRRMEQASWRFKFPGATREEAPGQPLTRDPTWKVAPSAMELVPPWEEAGGTLEQAPPSEGWRGKVAPREVSWAATRDGSRRSLETAAK